MCRKNLGAANRRLSKCQFIKTLNHMKRNSSAAIHNRMAGIRTGTPAYKEPFPSEAMKILKDMLKKKNFQEKR